MSDLKPTLQTLLVRLVLSLAILLLAVPSEAGTVKNDTDCTLEFVYLGKVIWTCPAHRECCLSPGLIDFGAFRLACNSNWSCSMPFFTCKTTARVWIKANGDPDCSRDAVNNTCRCGAQAKGGAAASVFPEFDWNGDGSVSRAEFRTTVDSHCAEEIPRLFEMLDQNGDGSVDGDEFRTAGEAP